VLVHFLTHPEVDIDPEVPVTEWSLSERGRMRSDLVAGALDGVTGVVSSPEVKADQTAHRIGDTLGLPVSLEPALAEIDRSATGYLPEPDFWANYQLFLALPAQSAKGWETAEAAQRRIVTAVRRLASTSAANDVLALVSHGGVGALLLCDLAGTPIQRLEDQPGQGSHFSFDAGSWQLRTSWQPFEKLVQR
jgi:broad specificity phosphatase PhoE